MERFSLWETAITAFDVANAAGIAAHLSAKLLAERGVDPGLKVSNYGGWHSKPDLALRPDPAFQAMLQMIVHHVGLAGGPPDARYQLHGWAMILDAGDYVVPHEHADAHWSTVFYLDGGDADGDAGAITFVDPRRIASRLPGDPGPSFTVRPRTGLLLVFPGWVEHFVHPYRGTRPRISVAVNLRLANL